MKRNGIDFPEIGLGGHPDLPREGTIALLRAALRAWEERDKQKDETELIIRANSRNAKKEGE